jgi:hypothetical protein
MSYDIPYDIVFDDSTAEQPSPLSGTLTHAATGSGKYSVGLAKQRISGISESVS